MPSATRRSHGVTPLAIVPPPTQLPHRRSSLLSVNSTVSSPHTPSCGSPRSSILFANPKRYSTDSWNSSNPPDDLEIEWKQEDASLLGRTLDALPAHLVTPFIGPIPPNNLLDKIARGIIQAKGSANWPYSIRATRIKLLELARLRAKEEAAPRAFRTSEEQPKAKDLDAEDEGNYTYGTPNEPRQPRKPLYRQSSMDFMSGAEVSLKDNENITRLSNRLQRPDRHAAPSSYHPYTRTPRSKLGRRSPSPALLSDVPSLVNPSTPGVPTLSSLTSLASARVAKVRARTLRHSASRLSSSSSGSSQLPVIETRRRSDAQSETLPAVPPKDKLKITIPSTPSVGSKRGPSFGAVAQASRPGHLLLSALSSGKGPQPGSYPSSDEEEKARSKGAKKVRTKDGIVDLGPPPTQVEAKPVTKAKIQSTKPATEDTSSKAKSPTSPVKTRSTSCAAVAEDPESGKYATPTKKPQAMNPDRNPSMFGSALPSITSIIRQQQESPSVHRTHRQPPVVATPSVPLPTPTPTTPGFMDTPPPPSPSPVVSISGTPMTVETPQTQIVRTLRRVKRLGPGPARRISFSNLKPDGAERVDTGNGGEASNTTLGSAIQLA
ncbi:hypothetical protein AX16_002707 [Volvariella volvacea WC 439]|nr:hypothetical protein AX16_002707 [Volvariella volvacea WC 439]